MNVCQPNRGLVALFAGAFLLGVPGCGTNIQEALFQASNAAGRTVLDIWLTNFANAVAGSIEAGSGEGLQDQDDLDADDGGDEGDVVDDSAPGDDDEADSAPGGSALDQLTGDVQAGEALYAANGCAACHGEDAAGGVGPALTEVGTDRLDDIVRGDAAHAAAKLDLSDQEVVDLHAYLESLGVDGGATGGDAVAGEDFFASNGCGNCHGADASGGFGPALGGVGPDRLDEMLRGDGEHPGGKFEATDEDLANLEAYLADL